MKPFFILISLFFLLLFSQFHVYAFEGTYKKKLTPHDVFFGKEDVYQVCYPKSHRTYFLSIIALLISNISLLGFILINSKRKNKLLNIKAEIIETQNKELLDSIVHAQRLQNALLPSINNKDTKVFYQPKNIVSGDFYWQYVSGNYSFFSVIDCTGHGVPGAFLSMLAHTAINASIIEQKLKDPTTILDTMNVYVKSALHQFENGNVQDGMEVGICVLNTVTKELQYAGAGINLLFLNDNKLNEIRAAKCTVGSVQSHINQKPKIHSVQLKKGDRIFMHSDGIVDQFGHLNNKKFTLKRLKQLIENTAVFNFEEQQNNIEQQIIIWKGSNEQTDDMLIMSVEV